MAKNSLIDLDRLNAVLQKYAETAAEMYKYNLSLGGKYGNKNASYDLSNSVTSRVEHNGSVYRVILNLNKYWEYVEGGARGEQSSPVGAVYAPHFPPPQVLLKWIEVKPIIPQPATNGKVPSKESLAYLIGRKIKREGIEPHPAMAQTRTMALQQFRQELRDALKDDIYKYITTLVTNK